jgi:DNA-directed RNA polymerase specialized sigma24 family protein
MDQNVLIMWKRISSLFSGAGGEIETEGHAADTMLRQLWIALVRIGVARGLMLPDAEDLGQESIVAGMQSFDPSRGDFGAFCRTIMVNKAKNHHRDKKPQEPIPEDGGHYRDPDDGPGWASYYKQCQERTDRILSETVSKLNEEEASFFMALAEVHEELSHGEVSEAARRAGITPQKGWDIFRKIQRQFKDLDRTILIPECPPERVFDPATRFSLVDPVSPPPSEAESFSLHTQPSDIPPSEGTYLGELQGRYRRFSTDLGPKSLRRLRGLFEQ